MAGGSEGLTAVGSEAPPHKRLGGVKGQGGSRDLRGITTTGISNVCIQNMGVTGRVAVHNYHFVYLVRKHFTLIVS